MAAKKKPTTSRVSPSKRGEGSKPKPKTTRVSPQARGENKTNKTAILAKKPKEITESGVGLYALTKVAQAAVKAASKAKSATPKARAKAAKAKSDAAWAKKQADDWVNLTGKYAMPKKPASKSNSTPKQRVVSKAEERDAARYVRLEKEKARRAEESMRARRNQNPPRTKSTPYRDRSGNTGWR